MNSVTKKLNWATELDVHEEGNKVLQKAKERERKLIRKGYRWYSLKPNYKVLIPCDEDGNPTDVGVDKLNKHKEMLNIV